MKPLLSAASWIYNLGTTCDRYLKSKNKIKLNHPVISVGNITMGGSGKTPLVIKLADDLMAHQLRPAILTRGYQGFLKPPSDASDEVMVMQANLPSVPIGVGPDRAESARGIESRQDVNIYILDDGYQHWKLARDLDIVCVDVTDPWGGGSVFPVGRLREPLSAIKRADIVVLTRCELLNEEHLISLEKDIKARHSKVKILRGFFKPLLFDWKGMELDVAATFRGKKVVALSAIGNPKAFEENLRQNQAEVIPARFMDHHQYTDRELDKVARECLKQEAILVTTEKDEVKLRKTKWGSNMLLPLHVLHVQLLFSSSDERIWQRSISW